MTESKYMSSKRGQMQAIADDLGKPYEDLEPWVDYDPITIDEIAWQVHKGRTGVVWTGD
jgi:hypothetical protein